MLATIMSSPDFAEACFLIALILFVIAMLVSIYRVAHTLPVVSAGLAFIALAFLAL